jgi:hypothetical protein
MDNYNWNHLLFVADILVQKGCLDENKLAMITTFGYILLIITKGLKAC